MSIATAPGTEWRVKRWHTVDGRLKPAEPPFLLEVEFDAPFIDLRHGELTGKGYESVEQAIQDGINKEEIKRALGGETRRVKVRIAEWDVRNPAEPTGNQLERTELDSIENMVDRHGLGALLWGIVEICDEKADHLRSNWQDERSARLWERVGKMVERSANGVGDFGKG